MKQYLLLAALAAAVGSAGAVTACATQRNPDVCCTTDADCERLGIPPTGCADGYVCTNFMCVAEQCATAADCTAARPVCDLPTATCTGCSTDADCAGYADAPVCDASGACRGCAADAECPSDVCDLDAGRCIDEAAVIYASPDGSDAASCSRANPCSAQRAVAASGPADTVIRLLPGIYTADIDIAASPAGPIIASGVTLQAMNLQVRSGAHAAIRGVMVRGYVQVRNPGSVLTLDRMTVQRSFTDETYIVSVATSDSGELRVTRSRFIGSTPASVGTDGTFDVDQSEFRLLDTEVAAPFSGIADGAKHVRISNSVFHGVLIHTGPHNAISDYRITHSTFTMSGNYPMLNCNVAPNSRVIFENNILLRTGTADAITPGADCTLSGNIVYPQVADIGSANRVIDPRLVDVDAQDLRLRPDSPAIDAAEPSSGANRDHDFDGTPRPQGAASDIGAFEYVP